MARASIGHEAVDRAPPGMVAPPAPGLVLADVDEARRVQHRPRAGRGGRRTPRAVAVSRPRSRRRTRR
ncbi:hypothetical protein C1708_28070 [Streptomyces sp. DH-12]|nr:hypothetical protein C1708_28070 [Streptomyces sp. DH-12]